MQNSIVRGTTVGAVFFLLLSSSAIAQVRSAGTVTRDVFGRAAYSSPTVSPYVNLGTNPNGLSNYQTLVRPMLDEREAKRAQDEAIHVARLQSRDTRDRREGAAVRSEDAPRSGQAPVRFMHYSHYYSGIR